MYAEAGMRPGIVMKEKTVFHVSVRTNPTGALLKFVMCSEVQACNFTTLVYSILLNIDKSELKMMETLWKCSLIIAKYS
jgi:hypothetical protein